jgi:hypothetical protein
MKAFRSISDSWTCYIWSVIALSYPRLLLVLICVCCWSTISLARAEQVDLMNIRVKRLTINAENIHLTLSRIANEYDIPIGLEVADQGSGKHPIKIHVKDAALRDVLNLIVRQDPRYEWAVTDGVVNVFPKRNRNSVLKDLLGTQVQSFRIEKGTSRFDVKVNMANLPEIRSFLERSNAAPWVAALSNRDYASLGPEFSLEMSNASLRMILNSIIGRGPTKYWIVSKPGNDNSIIINF